ncbi:ribonuclease, Rne/Rng family [Thermotoga petrophila RKU-10]|uniref:Ribonuclease, Rne/Rng family n=1 Tax=Thermotoga petrophila (strain ATCC BAA-489 / DSM 13996 / JCM 10882 / RKU-10) TaxID=590168 RepID=D2C3I3_THEP2|nr:ribonuclease E/G [Thermotoga petrophila]ADA67287.1 ribonuclease, Rne/Rng family [Thermotoga petrophila RKU-10]
MDDGELEEIFFDEIETIAGKIYLGKIEKIVPGLEAAFVKIGKGRNAFLKLSEINEVYRETILKEQEVKEGQKILVQVKKDASGKKGPQVTTQIGIADRFVVIFPFKKVIGVSRKIEDASERRRLRTTAFSLRKRHGVGVIMRTAAEGVDEEEIIKNFERALEKWNQVLQKFRRSRKPKLLHEEDPVEQIIKEKVNSKIDRLIYNNRSLLETLQKYLQNLPKKPELEYVEGDLFEKFSVYERMKKLLSRTVQLKSGGNIVIDRTEALTVIDVNSESYTDAENQEELALKTNMEAIEEIVRQLILRNIGGIVVIDFIKQKDPKSYEKLLSRFKEVAKRDGTRIEIFGFTNLGLLEITRKRTTRPLDTLLFTRCPVCSGTGKVFSQKILLKRIREDLKKLKNFEEVILKVHPNMSGYFKKEDLEKLQKEFKVKLNLDYGWHDPNSYEIKAKTKKGGK